MANNLFTAATGAVATAPTTWSAPVVTCVTGSYTPATASVAAVTVDGYF
jgi:hypothetical protein